MATALIQKMKLDKGVFLYGYLSGESCEQNRKDKVTRSRSVTYARYLGLLVNTLGSHLNGSKTTSSKKPNRQTLETFKFQDKND